MGRTFGSRHGWLWGLPALLLATGLFATKTIAEDGTTVFDVVGDRTVTDNADGSKTLDTTVTTTNTATGNVRTAVNETNVQQTESGRQWTRDTTVSGSNGFNLNSSTTGSSTNNGNGSGEWSSTTNGTVAGPKGNSVDYTTNRSGEWSRNDQGGRDSSMTATTTTSKGGTTTVNRSLSTYQVSDGVKGFTGESDRTFGNGATIDRTVNGTVTKTATGREWDATVDGTATGPNGHTRTWTTDIDGSITRNADGSRTLDVDKTITGQNGGTTSIEKDGTLTKGADGQWHYEGTKEVSHTPPTTAPKTSSSTTPLATSSTTKTTPPQAAGTAGEGQQSKWARWKDNAASGGLKKAADGNAATGHNQFRANLETGARNRGALGGDRPEHNLGGTHRGKAGGRR